MSNLENIQITYMSLDNVQMDKIETDIMTVLHANQNIKFTQYSLFNKVLESIYYGQYYHEVHFYFKSKFLFVLKYLENKYNDIIVKEDHDTTFIICLSELDPKLNYSNFPMYVENFSKPVSLNLKNQSQMFNYLYLNNPKEFENWIDIKEGNTIYHELVKSSNIFLIKELIKLNKFDFCAKNFKGNTPFDICMNQEKVNYEIANILYMELFNKFEEIRKINKYLEEYKNKIYLENKENKEKKERLENDKNNMNKFYFLCIVICFMLFYQ